MRSKRSGPCARVLPYRDSDEAIVLARRGGGSLVASVFSADDAHGRTAGARTCAFSRPRAGRQPPTAPQESTGHGSPLPHLVHGGPGRAGGGEEMGGIRGVLHYMQRTAVQGAPDALTAVGGTLGARRTAARSRACIRSAFPSASS